jgi:hypothetical protein
MVRYCYGPPYLTTLYPACRKTPGGLTAAQGCLPKHEFSILLTKILYLPSGQPTPDQPFGWLRLGHYQNIKLRGRDYKYLTWGVFGPPDSPALTPLFQTIMNGGAILFSFSFPVFLFPEWKNHLSCAAAFETLTDGAAGETARFMLGTFRVHFYSMHGMVWEIELEILEYL